MPKKINDAALLIGSLVLSVLAGFVPVDQSLSFQRAFSFFPFFVFGVICKKRNMMEKLEKVHLFVPIIVLIVSLLIARELPLFQPKEHFRSMNDAVLRISQSLLGLMMCLSIIRLSRVSVLLDKVAQLGMYTLWIFIGHTYLIVIGRKDLYTGFGYNLQCICRIIDSCIDQCIVHSDGQIL
jgi:hypothetical protein